MYNPLKFIGAILFITLVSLTATGQTNKEKALTMGREAIRLMDNGNIEESIKLLKEAQTLDPEKYDYPYEMAYANYINKDYKKAIEILEGLTTHKDITDRLYQLLGNSYDMNGDTAQAMEAYDKGLLKFPNSGPIYLEKGNMFANKENYSKALKYYEKGIEVDPAFSSNYYWACKIYLTSTEEVWGMIYGELFMNLERNSKRTSEISKLLFDTYKNEIKFTGKNSATVSFCQQMTISISEAKKDKPKLPFCMIYEPSLLIAIALQSEISLKSLNDIRTTFLANYYDAKRDKDYPNALFDYQKKVKDAGHFEAYNYWILMKGDEEEFSKWQKKHEEAWDAFVNWFLKNKIELNSNNKFYRFQY